tara:strand:- start:1448 stop:2605 length:1158 start_codon:yes stop_codon:yes gene_type:complete
MRQPATYYHAKESKQKIQVHQGGSRSGKTYSLLTHIVELCYHNEGAGAVVTICRKTFPALRASVMRDFFEILEREELYNPALHNKSDSTYRLYGNLIEFISVDSSEKVRGRKRDLLFINECNELSREDWRQLILRTTGRVYLDFNPSDEFHWIYDDVIGRDDADFFQTTYKDNPYLEQAVINEIERFKDVDENFWKVYGLGERGVNRSAVLTHWKQVKQIPPEYTLLNYGLDFGYTNDPSCIVAVYSDGNGFCLDEICYSTGLSNDQICKIMQAAGIESSDIIIADCAEPKSIDYIHGQNFNVHPCRKGADSIRAGIDYLRSHPLMVTERSVNGIKELRNYKYKEDKNGRILNSPVDLFNHFIDASRYAITFNQSNPNYGSYSLG